MKKSAGKLMYAIPIFVSSGGLIVDADVVPPGPTIAVISIGAIIALGVVVVVVVIGSILVIRAIKKKHSSKDSD